MLTEDRVVRVAGRTFSNEEQGIVAEIVAKGVDVSRTQLMVRTCEQLDWRRPSGACKVRECRDLLLRLESDGWFKLPPKRQGRPVGLRTRVPVTAAGEPGPEWVGSVGEFGTLSVELVRSKADRALFRELVGRYHYLGYRVPFGAQLRYLAFLSKPKRTVVAAMGLSSPAWRLAARDRWIGWDEPTRERNLQRVVGNSRFLILPWIKVRNLASRLLSLLMRQVGSDWEASYGVAPLLAETMVDVSRFKGTCYRAANWIELGQTTGRGRMDREHRRHGHAPKRILVYPLVRHAARQLREV
jgi:hypothetical protein